MRFQGNSLLVQNSYADMQQRILGGVTVRPVIKALRNCCQNIETVLSSYVCVSRINNKYYFPIIFCVLFNISIAFRILAISFDK